ncbi:MAG: Hsp20/alpha crystallin family protein [Myxococcales bacterium]|nr:Hsp20/alpha crystallin family protein [Myxococcales bacterium]
MDALQKDFERFFHDELLPQRFFEGFFDTPLGEWKPALEIVEEEELYRVKVDLPEVKREDIELKVENDVMTISGQRQDEREETKAGYYYSERRVGSFTRSFRLPKHVDDENVSAEYRDGVLTVTLPKAAVSRGRTIDVR